MIGIVHPGQMGAALGDLLVDAGHRVGWASAGRGADTRERAARLTDLGDLDRLAAACDVVLSVCPPHAAVATADAFTGYDGIFTDLNAVSPRLTGRIGAALPRFVDGAVVGPPPRAAGSTRVFLAGPEADAVAALFTGTAAQPIVLGAEQGRASAVKMTYAAWSKGTTALLLAARATARRFGVEDALVAEWERSQPELPGRSADAARLATERGWRWAFELAETGETFAAAGLPSGFGAAAAEVFGGVDRDGDPALDAVLDRLAGD